MFTFLSCYAPQSLPFYSCIFPQNQMRDSWTWSAPPHTLRAPFLDLRRARWVQTTVKPLVARSSFALGFRSAWTEMKQGAEVRTRCDVKEAALLQEFLPKAHTHTQPWVPSRQTCGCLRRRTVAMFQFSRQKNRFPSTFVSIFSHLGSFLPSSAASDRQLAL